MNEDYDEDALANYLESEQFQEEFKERMEKETSNKRLPKIYIIARHWKDGTIEIIEENG